MSRLASLGCAVVLLGASSGAWAGAETGFYLGASTGTANSDFSYNQPGLGYVSYDDNDTGYKVFLGYNFGVIPLVNLAIEGSYADFGTATGTISGTSIETSVDGWNAFGLLGFNLGPIQLFAKAGAMRWDAEAVSSLGTVSDSGTDPAYGVGLQFQIKSLAIRAEYEVVDAEIVNAGFGSIGLSYTF